MILRTDLVIKELEKIEINSSPFHVEIESVPEYLQMDLIDIQ